MSGPSIRIGLAGLGALGGAVARRLADGEIPGVELAAATGRTPDRARTRLDQLGLPDLPAVEIGRLVEICDLVIEAAPAGSFRDIAEPVLAAGRTLVVVSAGALLENADLLALPGRVLAPSGAVGGLDIIRAAAADGGVESLTLLTRKPMSSLIDAPYLRDRRETLARAASAVQVFLGDARAAARAFPASANVAACLALAGPGPERTLVEIWGDPRALRNSHRVEMVSGAASFTLQIESPPMAENPRTSRLAMASVMALLQAMTARLRIGS